MKSLFGDLWKRAATRAFVGYTTGLLLACVALSFAFGQLVVKGPGLYGLGFFVYGGLGYIAIVMALFFFIYARKGLLAFKAMPRLSVAFLLASALFAGAFAYLLFSVNARPSLVDDHRLALGLLAHTLFVLIFVLLALGTYGFAFIRSFLSTFRKQMLICAGVGVAFYASMRVVWLSWPYLSWGVSRLVYLLLQVFPGDPRLVPPQTIIVKSFGVLIGEACSGVFSIFLFTCLFLLIVALDWQTLRAGRVALLFFLTIAGLFLVNVLRVYLIILVGVFYDPDFAVNLFHSYIGMLLFMTYFVVWLHYCYDWMKK